MWTLVHGVTSSRSQNFNLWHEHYRFRNGVEKVEQVLEWQEVQIIPKKLSKYEQSFCDNSENMQFGNYCLSTLIQSNVSCPSHNEPRACISSTSTSQGHLLDRPQKVLAWLLSAGNFRRQEEGI